MQRENNSTDEVNSINEIPKKYEEKLNAWSTDAGGEKKNIRTLLTTVRKERKIFD